MSRWDEMEWWLREVEQVAASMLARLVQYWL